MEHSSRQRLALESRLRRTVLLCGCEANARVEPWVLLASFVGSGSRICCVFRARRVGLASHCALSYLLLRWGEKCTRCAVTRLTFLEQLPVDLHKVPLHSYCALLVVQLISAFFARSMSQCASY